MTSQSSPLLSDSVKDDRKSMNQRWDQHNRMKGTRRLSHFILGVRVFEKEEESDPKDDRERERHPEHALPQGKASSSAEPPKNPIIVHIGLSVEITPFIRGTCLVRERNAHNRVEQRGHSHPNAQNGTEEYHQVDVV